MFSWLRPGSARWATSAGSKSPRRLWAALCEWNHRCFHCQISVQGTQEGSSTNTFKNRSYGVLDFPRCLAKFPRPLQWWLYRTSSYGTCETLKEKGGIPPVATKNRRGTVAKELSTDSPLAALSILQPQCACAVLATCYTIHPSTGETTNANSANQRYQTYSKHDRCLLLPPPQ